MLIRSTTRLRFLRLALFAVLLNALGPAFAQALAASRPAMPIDVCASHGGRALAVAAALLTQDAAAGAVHGGDCGHCLAHACTHGGDAGPGLPPASPLALPAAPGQPVAPAFMPPGARPLPQLAGAPTRGPPHFS
jgi:hypothetical protein